MASPEFYRRRTEERKRVRKACLAIECPMCGATPGEPCQDRRPEFEGYTNATPHRARYGKFRAMEDGRCPIEPTE